MEITSKEEAAAAIEAVAKWLESEALAQREKMEESPWPNEPGIADTARDWCIVLLDDAYAEGMGGCPLCQG